ncbi:MAG: hypothetical protein K0R82_1844 [Flavipsychrobacter sp.]|jgi:hypothetical protein|nr:hypothetical protein [Flavipsychrobacter sp.]
MRTLLTLAILSFSFSVSFAQAGSDAKTNVKKAAKDMGIALVKKNYNSFIKTTYPKAVEATQGGHDQLIKELKGQLNQMEQEGTTVVAMWPGEPSKFIDTAGELQCTIPQSMTMKVPEGKLTTHTTLIALSPDKGKTWYFMDTADRSIRKMRELFPNISTRLVIPKSPDETFVPDKKK